MAKKTKKSSQWFEISEDGFRRMNAGRPLGELVREAVQNAMDTSAASIAVTVDAKSVSITDDGDGVSDPDLIHTVFLTDKEDSPTKRGRKGRGLKELIVAGDTAVINTVGVCVEFNKHGRHETKTDRKSGTLVVVKRTKPWSTEEVAEAVSLLEMIVPDEGSAYSVNGKQIARPARIGGTMAVLKTVVIEGGVEKTSEREGEVELLKSGSAGWVMEMGIPVQSPNGDDLPFNINVGQRVPLTDNRNVIDPEYLSSVYAVAIDLLIKDELFDRKYFKQSWFDKGVGSFDLYGQRAKTMLKAVLDVRSLRHCVIKSTSNRRANDRAKQLGLDCIDASTASANLFRLMQIWIKSAQERVKQIEDSAPKRAVKNNSRLHDKVKRFSKAICEAVLTNENVAVDVELFDEGANVEGSKTMARWQRGYSNSTLFINVQGTKDMFSNLMGEKFLGLLVHEITHQFASDHYNDKYINAQSKVAARLALILATQPKIRKMGTKGAASSPQSAEKKAAKAARRAELKAGVPYGKKGYEAFKRCDLYVIGSILGVNTFKINKTPDIIDALVKAEKNY